MADGVISTLSTPRRKQDPEVDRFVALAAALWCGILPAQEPEPRPPAFAPDTAVVAELRGFVSALSREWERSADPADHAYGSLLGKLQDRVGALSLRGVPAALDVPTTSDGTYLLDEAVLRLNPEFVEKLRAFGEASRMQNRVGHVLAHLVRKELGGYLHLERYPFLERSRRLLLRMWDDEIQRSGLHGKLPDEVARNPHFAAIAKRLAAIWAGQEAAGYVAGFEYLSARGFAPGELEELARQSAETADADFAGLKSMLATLAINLEEHLGADGAHERRRRAALYQMITVSLAGARRARSAEEEFPPDLRRQLPAFHVAYSAEVANEDSLEEPNTLPLGLLDGLALPGFMSFLTSREYYAPKPEEIQRLVSDRANDDGGVSPLVILTALTGLVLAIASTRRRSAAGPRDPDQRE